MSKVITLPDAPPPIGPYCLARLCGNTLYTSGNVAQAADGTTPAGIAEQTTLSLQNMEKVIKAAGMDKTNVVKCNCYLAKMEDFAEMNKAYSAFFGDHKPCRCCVQAGKLCDPFLFEVECICYKA